MKRDVLKLFDESHAERDFWTGDSPFIPILHSSDKTPCKHLDGTGFHLAVLAGAAATDFKK
jgi:hypothetical protein